MEIRVKRKPEYTDELQHYKYTRKEKKNGKWVYYYDKPSELNALTDKQKQKLKDVANEAERKADNLLYDAHKKALDVEKKTKLYKIDKDNSKSKIEKTARRASVITSNTVRRGATSVLRALNNVGKGKLDNRIRKSAAKGKEFFKSLFS